MSKGQSPINPAEVGNAYVDDSNRFVVSLIVGYSEDDGVKTPHEALAAALALTTGGSSDGTQWHVFDRKTQKLHLIEQSDAVEPEMDDGRPDRDESHAIGCAMHTLSSAECTCGKADREAEDDEGETL